MGTFSNLRAKSVAMVTAAMFGLAGPLAAACVDGVDGPKRAPFEIFKAAILEGNFDDAASQINLGGKRKRNIQASMSKLEKTGLGAFETCILVRRTEHSPNFMSEIVYFSDNGTLEYWLLLSGIQIDGETQLIDVVFTNDYKRFRGWLQ